MNLGWISAACLVSCLSFSALANNVAATDPAVLANIISGYGSANLTTNASGNPRIESRIDGIRFNVIFYGCTENTNCGSVQFTSSWKKPGLSLEKINSWNRDKRFGKAYLDNEGDPVIEMDVNLRHGVSHNNFDDTVDFWNIVLRSFRDEMIN